MRSSIFKALLVCAALGAASSLARASDVLSDNVSGPLMEAQDAIKAQDYATALKKIQEAQAVSGRTAYDDYIINQFLANASMGTHDYATATAALVAMADSPALPASDKKQVLTNATLLASNAQNWPNVVRFGAQLEAMGPLDLKVIAPLAVAYYNMNQMDKAVVLARRGIAAANAAGVKPEEALLNLVARSEEKQGGGGSLDALAQTYGSPESWAQVLDATFASGGVTDRIALDIFRLRIVTKAITSADDYDVMAKLAMDAGYPGEAVAMLQQAASAGKMPPGGAALLAQAKAKAGASKASIAGLSGGKAGADVLKAAELSYGFGDYAGAEQLATRALSVGADAAVGHMVLGMAQALQGKNAAAAASLAAVKGSAAQLKAAHDWTLYATRKY